MAKKDNIQEVIRKVRQIEIRAKRLSDHIFAGEYHTSFKGRGMSFAEVREYQYGDEVRNIDWNVTARYGHPFVKEFEEERELNIFLMVDISDSEVFGSKGQTKREIITDIAAMLAFSALRNNDKVGLILFSDKVLHILRPKNGKKHVLHIIRDILSYENDHSTYTDINPAMDLVMNVQKRKTICFLLSDFITKDFSKNLATMSKRHDVIGVHVWDALDEELPKMGLVNLRDPETQKEMWVDTSDKETRAEYAQNFKKNSESLQKLFSRYALDMVNVRTDMDYVPQFQTFFKNRMRHRG